MLSTLAEQVLFIATRGHCMVVWWLRLEPPDPESRVQVPLVSGHFFLLFFVALQSNQLYPSK